MAMPRPCVLTWHTVRLASSRARAREGNKIATISGPMKTSAKPPVQMPPMAMPLPP